MNLLVFVLFKYYLIFHFFLSPFLSLSFSSFSSLTNGMGLRSCFLLVYGKLSTRVLLLFFLPLFFWLWSLLFFQVVESISDTSVVVYTLLCKNRRHWNQTRCICFQRVFFLLAHFLSFHFKIQYNLFSITSALGLELFVFLVR